MWCAMSEYDDHTKLNKKDYVHTPLSGVAFFMCTVLVLAVTSVIGVWDVLVARFSPRIRNSKFFCML